MSDKQRPKGISVLSWLFILGGLAALVLSVILSRKIGSDPEALGAIELLGIPPLLFVVSLFTLSILSLVSGIGMWLGKGWGWYLGSFYCIYAIARNLHAIIMITLVMSAFDPSDAADLARGPSYYYLKHGLRIVIYILLYIYFFKKNVRAYFSLANRPIWRVIVTQVIVCILIIAASYISTFVI